MSGPATGPADRLRAVAGAVPMRAVAGAVAMRVAAVLLGAGSLVWAALPAVHRAYVGLALALAIAGVSGVRHEASRYQRPDAQSSAMS